MPRTLVCSQCSAFLELEAGEKPLDAAYLHVVENLAQHPMRLVVMQSLDGAFEAIIRRSWPRAFR